ncbi:hypothetical protein EXS53_02515 [Patescibacteria group bacterium]|nr:hypothetical protein [Patescibacteria group bacterium]
MYKYVQNSHSAAKIDEQLTTKIHTELAKHRIDSQFMTFNSEKELSALLETLGKSSATTIVVVGDDYDFNILIGTIGKIDSDTAIGYLPIVKSKIAKNLQIHSWLDAVRALAQRKITEKTIYSIANRYFYDTIYLAAAESNDSVPSTIKIRTEGNLELTLPPAKISFENLNEDHYFNNAPIQVSAHEPGEAVTKKSSLKTKIINIFDKKSLDQGKLLLSLHSKIFNLEGADNLVDNFGRKYKNIVTIGKYNKKIRLISKKTNQKSN